MLLCSLMMITLGMANSRHPDDWLHAHNGIRIQMGLPALVWDDRLADYAKWYANERRGDCRLEHSDTPFGENLAWADYDMKGSEAIQMWIDEVKDYDYNSNTCRVPDMCGHYTQVVWRNTARVGCARVKCHNGNTFFTCNYDPPGNFVGAKPY